MPISYVVEKVEAGSLQVRYQDGSYAIIPLDKSSTRDQIKQAIAAYSNTQEPFDSAADVPFAEGDVGEVPTDKELREQQQQQNQLAQLTYQDLRRASYPSIGDQLDALYWDRMAKPEPLEQINETITQVKQKFPKDMKPISAAEAAASYGVGVDMPVQELIDYLES